SAASVGKGSAEPLVASSSRTLRSSHSNSSARRWAVVFDETTPSARRVHVATRSDSGCLASVNSSVSPSTSPPSSFACANPAKNRLVLNQNGRRISSFSTSDLSADAYWDRYLAAKNSRTGCTSNSNVPWALLANAHTLSVTSVNNASTKPVSFWAIVKYRKISVFKSVVLSRPLLPCCSAKPCRCQPR